MTELEADRDVHRREASAQAPVLSGVDGGHAAARRADRLREAILRVRVASAAAADGSARPDRRRGDARNAALERLGRGARQADHAELWLRFGGRAGDPTASEVTNAKLHESTRALVDTYREAAETASIPCGVAALYAYESQLPAVAEAKIEGLKAHFGIESRDGLAFFEVHRAIDVQHAAAERRVLEEATDGDGDDVASTWARRALDAWWAFLDGIRTSRACPVA